MVCTYKSVSATFFNYPDDATNLIEDKRLMSNQMGVETILYMFIQESVLNHNSFKKAEHTHRLSIENFIQRASRSLLLLLLEEYKKLQEKWAMDPQYKA